MAMRLQIYPTDNDTHTHTAKQTKEVLRPSRKEAKYSVQLLLREEGAHAHGERNANENFPVRN